MRSARRCARAQGCTGVETGAVTSSEGSVHEIWGADGGDGERGANRTASSEGTSGGARRGRETERARSASVWETDISWGAYSEGRTSPLLSSPPPSLLPPYRGALYGTSSPLVTVLVQPLTVLRSELDAVVVLEFRRRRPRARAEVCSVAVCSLCRLLSLPYDSGMSLHRSPCKSARSPSCAACARRRCARRRC